MRYFKNLVIVILSVFLCSCSPSLTDYGYMGGLQYTDFHSHDLTWGHVTTSNIDIIMSTPYPERDGYCYPKDSVVVAHYYLPEKDICVDGRCFYVKTLVNFIYEQYKGIFQEIQITTAAIDMQNEKLVYGNSFQSSNVKHYLMRAKYIVEIPDIKKDDKTMFLLCDFQVNPLNAKYSKAKYRKKFVKK